MKKKAHNRVWIAPVRKGYVMECCTCGMKHQLDFRLHKDGNRHVILFKIKAHDGDISWEDKMRGNLTWMKDWAPRRLQREINRIARLTEEKLEAAGKNER